ncbi:rod shape-determining protein MreD [Luminiphilus syltensis NOR5-1B]|uniref:Rod shape-determining protein MreD n=1 Tax=Luminiphilus syltensis NOR5-1B TaxID=565045 RepID=B8KR95_9GAMM|nr:rod shape-determining protein MreD [Luminiphilus syltensis]EED35301.1 rod shape-determining protein MreD [Luminiphilus syltensis NOR5-1B]
MERAQAVWVIPVTLMVALLLHAAPLPFEWRWFRPELPLLVLFYWVLALPQRVGLLSAAVIGIGIDLLEGSALGGLALGLVVSTLVLLFTYQRIRQFNLFQQCLLMGLLIALALTVENWVHKFMALPTGGMQFLWPALVSMPFWAVIRKPLRGLRRYYGVT